MAISRAAPAALLPVRIYLYPSASVCVAVCVERAGGGSAWPRRFVVRVVHLSHPTFLELLGQAEE
jgi:hypothetical protein